MFRESKGFTEAKFQELGAMFTSLPGPIDQVEAHDVNTARRAARLVKRRSRA
jgi:hypothetical protein